MVQKYLLFIKNQYVLTFQKFIRSSFGLGLVFFWGILVALGFQGEDKTINQRVFNMVEFYLSQKQTDSIYNLAASEFQATVSRENFETLFNTQIYPMGRIVSAKQVEFDPQHKIAKYRVDFEGLTLQFILGVNSERKFSTFLIQPYTPTRDESLPVIQSAPKSEELQALVEEVANQYIRKPHTKGLAIGIIKPSETQEFYFGQKGTQDSKKPDGNSVFEIGSITKTFTAALTSYVLNQAQINIEDKIVGFLPDSLKQIAGLQNITFKNLANHTSGLPRLPDNMDHHPGFQPENPYLLYDESALFQFLQTLDRPAAEYPDYEYSNLGYGLLGLLLEKITGQSYAELLKINITEPLQMLSTQSVPADDADLLPVHETSGQRTPAWDFKVFEAAGGLKASLPDMILYAKSQLRTPDTDLEKAFAETRQFAFFLPPDTDIGLAWNITLLGDHLIYWHNGGTGGSRSFIGLCPDKKSAVVILSNANESVDEIGRVLLENLLK